MSHSRERMALWTEGLVRRVRRREVSVAAVAAEGEEVGGETARRVAGESRIRTTLRGVVLEGLERAVMADVIALSTSLRLGEVRVKRFL